MVERRGNNGGGDKDWLGRSNNGWNMNTIFDMSDISEKTRQHLVRVYTTLLTCAGACAGGAVVNSTFMFSGIMMSILSFAVMCYGIYSVVNRDNSENYRIGALVMVAAFMGFQSGPALHHVAEVNPQILTSALAYTTGAFGSFSAVALFSQRRSMLFLGGIISTMCTTLFIYSMMGMLMGSNPLGIGYLFITLFMTCIWIIFDTQMIVERAESGDRDVPGHSMTLFFDLFDLFIKILRLMEYLDDGKKKK